MAEKQRESGETERKLEAGGEKAASPPPAAAAQEKSGGGLHPAIYIGYVDLIGRDCDRV